MPLVPGPALDDRTYAQILEVVKNRIPVHTPEWTNFVKADPGVTLLELFAFMTETLLYRVNLMPERNRRAFLSLLGVGVQPGAAALGLVSVQNVQGERQVLTLPARAEFSAGSVPFRSARPLEVLPLEARVYYKHPVQLPEASQPALDDLYASFFPDGQTGRATPYESLELGGAAGASSTVSLGQDTVDGALWLALMLRPADRPAPATPAAWAAVRREVAAMLAGRVLSLGVVPDVQVPDRQVRLAGEAAPAGLNFALPRAELNVTTSMQARYRPLSDLTALDDVLNQPGTLELVLPGADQLDTWRGLAPLEAGVGDLPPALDDPADDERVLTWIRVSSSQNSSARISWLGINALSVRQERWVYGERLPDGNGEPDQRLTLTQTPVLPETLRLSVSVPGSPASEWTRADDLASADPEVPVPDLRQPPHQSTAVRPLQSEVYTLDPASGEVLFGDGFHGKRPAAGAQLRADYAVSLGAAGNVERGQIRALHDPRGELSVSNPVRTWGGAAPQSLSDAEKGVPLYLQHRDRLVNAQDFQTLASQTPGVEVGRVEVLPACHPGLSASVPGDAPGAVTLMLIPLRDPKQPDAPTPDRLFMDAVCAYLEPRRLITTELFLRPPVYVPIWVSVGLEVVGGAPFSGVRDAVKAALTRFLSPLPAEESDLRLWFAPRPLSLTGGWPLGKAVLAGELLTEVSRVAGVRVVNALLLGRAQGPQTQISLQGLELPRLVGLSITQGNAVELDALQGQTPIGAPPSLPVPFTPQDCR